MLKTDAYGTAAGSEPLAPMQITRREPGPEDVLLEIAFCGVCHTDIHLSRDEWGFSMYPLVPGHEIVGHVAAVGDRVTRFKVGDAVGVGCFVDSCRVCEYCAAGEEQFCNEGATLTYNSKERDGRNLTFGGYSTQVTVDQAYVLSIPDGLPLDRAAPLLCAGITTYSPLRSYGAGPGKKVAVVGLGGLGHVAVKLAVAMGAEVTVLSSSPSKRADALALGAHEFAATADGKVFTERAGQYHLIIDTVSAPHDLNTYLSLLRVDGTMVLLGVPDKPAVLAATSLIMRRHTLTGSFIGGIAQTQEMLDFCAANGVAADIEVIPMSGINDAYERMLKSDVRYRFVIDMDSLRAPAAA
ncbi:NAD(P)-dependent alcohol dehydrogenase [soil metagenome]